MSQSMLHLKLTKDLMAAVVAEAERQSAAGVRRVTRTEVVSLCVASALGLLPSCPELQPAATFLSVTGDRP